MTIVDLAEWLAAAAAAGLIAAVCTWPGMMPGTPAGDPCPDCDCCTRLGCYLGPAADCPHDDAGCACPCTVSWAVSPVTPLQLVPQTPLPALRPPLSARGRGPRHRRGEQR